MPKINQLSKEAVRLGIYHYLISQDKTFNTVNIDILLANELWRSVKHVESRRQKNINELLQLVSNVDSSHEELHVRILDYLEDMGKGLLGRSKLRDFIYCELGKINPLKLDQDNLLFLQSIVDKDPEGRISLLLSRIGQLEEELQTAEMLHKSDQEQIRFLRVQIKGLQTTVRETQQELAQALTVIEENKLAHKQSERMISNLLLLLQTKGIINEADITQVQPIEDPQLAKSSPIPIVKKGVDLQDNSDVESTRSRMSVCSIATTDSRNLVASDPSKINLPAFRV